MAGMTRAQLRKEIDAAAAAVHKIPQPDWQSMPDVYAKWLDAFALLELERLEESMNGTPDSEKKLRSLACLCAIGLCDSTGLRLYENSELDNVMAKPFRLLEYWAREISDYNGLDEGGETARKKSAGQSAKAVRVRSGKGTRTRKRR